MNWKINYWTILFAIATIAAVYFKMNSPVAQNQPHPDEPCPVVDTCASLALPPGLGEYGEGKFMSSGFAFKTSNLDTFKVTDLGVDGFMLHACELRQIVNFKSADTHVFANFALLPKGNTDSTEIRLIFKATAADNQVQYFDFSRPCPICPPRG